MDKLTAALSNPAALHSASPIINAALDKLLEIQALQSSQNDAIQSLFRSGDIKMPDGQPVPKEMIEALLSITPTSLESLRELTNDITANASSSGTPPTEEIVAEQIASLATKLHECYVAIPQKKRKAVLVLLPKEARVAAVALSFMSSEGVGNIVKSIPRLEEAVVNLQNSEDVTPEFRNKRIDGAMFLRKIYMSIPERARRTVMQLVPEEGRPMIETAEGLSSKKDFEQILDLVDGKTTSSKAVASGGNGDNGSSSVNNEATAMNMAGEEKTEQSEERKAAGMAASGAGLVARGKRFLSPPLLLLLICL